ALRDLVAGLQVELRDLAGVGRRHVHRGLVGLDGDEALLDLDGVSLGDEDVDDFDVGEVADVRDGEFHRHRTSPSTLSRTFARRTVKRTASAPSITRWSYDSDSGSIRRGLNSLPSQTGFIVERDTPRIATS